MNPEEIWCRKTDDEVVSAATHLDQYTASGQDIIKAEMQRRGLALPSGDDQPRVSTSRYFVAVLACAAIVLAYSAIGALLGWKNTGGVFPMMLLFAALGVTWRRIMRQRNRQKPIEEGATTSDGGVASETGPQATP